MRCKKHLNDPSSSAGVCASCLRERLFALIAAQAQEDRRRKSELQQQQQPPPLVFPRSVSPYISRRKSDNADRLRERGWTDRRFFSTPQVGPTGAVVVEEGYKKKKRSRLYFLTHMFRSKSEKVDSDPRVSDSVPNSRDSFANSSSSSQSWLSTILSGRRKKPSRTFSVEESTTGGQRIIYRNRDRGMSPARCRDDEEDGQCCDGSSGYSSESSQGWKQTPMRATARTPARRGGSRLGHSRNVSGLTFCLSPLVRASPNRHYHQKGIAPEVGLSGEIRVAVKPHTSNAASFCKNRSRKLADFGRFTPNR